MKIIQYKTMIDEDGKNILVKERSSYFSDIDRIDTTDKIAYMIRSVFDAEKLAEEYAWLLALDAKCKLIGLFELSHGTVNVSIIGTREIFVKLYLCGATAFVLVHNHPSGVSEPSDLDIESTKKVQKAGEIMGIPLLDHIIVSKENYCSLKENGVLSDEGKEE